VLAQHHCALFLKEFIKEGVEGGTWTLLDPSGMRRLGFQLVMEQRLQLNGQHHKACDTRSRTQRKQPLGVQEVPFAFICICNTDCRTARSAGVFRTSECCDTVVTRVTRQLHFSLPEP